MFVVYHYAISIHPYMSVYQGVSYSMPKSGPSSGYILTKGGRKKGGTRARTYEHYCVLMRAAGSVPKSRGGFAHTSSSRSPAQVVEWLKEQTEAGLLLTANAAARPRIINGSIPYSTDSVVYAQPKSVVCYQALLVSSTGLSLDALGIHKYI
jgi:hypothetical protein